MKIFLIIIAVAFACVSWAHEEYGYKHTTQVGPAISGRHCPGNTQVWAVDDDGDGKVDRCVSLIFAHEAFHVRQLPLVDGKCQCPE